ncbi:hypothetical protein PIB30_057400 [Stylosanthes scabra]|uniref:Uncharacterized protein n=1 Tax=Stylosanthes scabra TaxID=79078 RepID=A0ABU6WI10_9FABA|nr:hypothetical protein [Stylosanthes scabra]
MESEKSGCSRGVEFVQRGIWWFSVLIFLGYIVLWIMVPTNTFYLHWLPAIQATTDSIYFGKQATLASLYLHLESKRSDCNTRSKVGFFGLVSWKKPLLVNGSLGIISLRELSLIFMFLLYLIWSLYSYLHDWFQQVALLAANEGDQVGGQAGRFSTGLRPCWEYLLGVSVLSSIKSVFNFTIRWPNFRGKYQVPHLARTHCNGPLHSPWNLLHYILGQDPSNLRDAHVEKIWHLKCGWRSSFASRISHVGHYLTFDKAKSL